MGLAQDLEESAQERLAQTVLERTLRRRAPGTRGLGHSAHGQALGLHRGHHRGQGIGTVADPKPGDWKPQGRLGRFWDTGWRGLGFILGTE
eukprot:Skav206307  [mRNA]  locus=scaffold4747:65223:65495:+ [translate_table: standard]